MLSPWYFFADSKVYTPDSEEYSWEKAKAYVEMEDGAVGQIDSHLFQTHLPMELFCMTYPKHINPTHPLYQLKREHCVGTSAVGSIAGDQELIKTKGPVDRIINFGRDGAIHMMNKLHQKEHYDDFDFMARLKVCIHKKLPWNILLTTANRENLSYICEL